MNTTTTAETGWRVVWYAPVAGAPENEVQQCYEDLRSRAEAESLAAFIRERSGFARVEER